VCSYHEYVPVALQQHSRAIACDAKHAEAVIKKLETDLDGRFPMETFEREVLLLPNSALNLRTGKHIPLEEAPRGTFYVPHMQTPQSLKAYEAIEGLINQQLQATDDAERKRERFLWLAMIGRCFRPFLDKHSSLLILLGRSGCGKGTLMALIESVFGAGEVGVLDGMSKKDTFALASVIGKRLAVMHELSEFPLSENTLMAMVEQGTPLSLRKMRRIATSVDDFGMPTIMASNQLPWTDPHGRVFRRSVFLPFNRRPEKRNPGLLDELKPGAALLVQHGIDCAVRLGQELDQAGCDVQTWMTRHTPALWGEQLHAFSKMNSMFALLNNQLSTATQTVIRDTDACVSLRTLIAEHDACTKTETKEVNAAIELSGLRVTTEQVCAVCGRLDADNAGCPSHMQSKSEDEVVRGCRLKPRASAVGNISCKLYKWACGEMKDQGIRILYRPGQVTSMQTLREAFEKLSGPGYWPRDPISVLQAVEVRGMRMAVEYRPVCLECGMLTTEDSPCHSIFNTDFQPFLIDWHPANVFVNLEPFHI
jgi:hypothetical protein